MNKKRKGMALLEIIVAVAVMAMLIGGIMQGLNMTILGSYQNSRFNTALHLAQSQMEYVKEQPFAFSQSYLYIDEPKGFDIELTVDNGDEGKGYEYGVSGLQLITVTVTCESNNVMLQEYKIDR